MEVTISFRTDKPEKSGYYIGCKTLLDEKKPYFMSVLFYNAETQRWNDIEGDGRTAMDIDAWAEVPEVLE